MIVQQHLAKDNKQKEKIFDFRSILILLQGASYVAFIIVCSRLNIPNKYRIIEFIFIGIWVVLFVLSIYDMMLSDWKELARRVRSLNN